jgi:hypothetical protein
MVGLETLATLSLLLGQYVYEQDLTRIVALERLGLFYLGHLDAAGNFIEDITFEPFRVNAPYSGPHFRELNWPRTKTEKVYEYRSGRLIRGRWSEDGNFVPDLGSKVIEFGEYRYSPNAPRIYNLPGRFVLKTSASRSTNRSAQ